MNYSDVSLKKVFITICAFTIIVLISILIHCDKNSTSPEEISSRLVAHSDCGEDLVTAKVSTPGNDQTGVEYSYDGEGTLQLFHLNAGFNCCSTIGADISFISDTILIEEKESGEACHCLCLYDLEFEITDLSPGTYQLKIAELYTAEGDDLLEFEIVLGSSVTTGDSSVVRDHYPWYSEPLPTGILDTISSCGGFDVAKIAIPPTDSNCIIYEYDGISSLQILHQNTIFNCCPIELSAEINIVNDTIYIEESEEEGLCDCICDYDFDYEVINLPPGEYHVVLNQAYNNYEAVLDLVNEQSGYVCFEASIGGL